MIYETLIIPIYRTRIDLVIDRTIQSAIDNYELIDMRKPNDRKDSKGGLTMPAWKDQSLIIIMCIDNITHEIIAHEVHHANNFIMSSIGAPARRNADENDAYLVGFITDLIYKTLKNYPNIHVTINRQSYD